MNYKLLIIKNRYTKKLDLKRGLDWFSEKTPLRFEVSEMVTDFEVDFQKSWNDTKSGVTLGESIKEKLRSVVPRNTYHAVVFVYGNKSPGVRLSTVDLIPLFEETEFIELAHTADKGKALNHELFHAFFAKLRKLGILLDDPMDKVVIDNVVYHYYNNDSLTASKSNRTISLDRLKPHWDKVVSMAPQSPTMPVEQPSTTKYKYFTSKELEGLKIDLCDKLDKARELAGIPFKLTSTLRDPEKNSAVGGVQNSAHLKGEAADIACTDGVSRWKIVNALIAVGIKRIGIGNTFIHADVSATLPSPVIFDYYK